MQPALDPTHRHRAALRAEGLRPRLLWLPDLRGERAAELRRQSARIAARANEADDLAFAEHAQFWPSDPA